MLFIFFMVVGFGLSIIAIKFRIKKNRLKEIAGRSTLASPLPFSVNKSGMYSISLIGISADFDIKDLSPKLKSSQNNDLTTNRYDVKYNFVRRKKICSCQWYFFANQKGNYELRFDNLEEFILKYPILTSRRIKSRKFQTEKLGVLIKEGMKSEEYRLMVIATMFGFTTFLFGVIGFLNLYQL